MRKKRENIIDKLFLVIKNRQIRKPKKSYTSYLFKKGTRKIIEKVLEESKEVIKAAKKGRKKDIIYEVADLWYHLLVLLAKFDLKPKDVYNELIKRRKNKNYGKKIKISYSQ